MTREELKQKIDSYFGMKSRISKWLGMTVLEYYSPTSVLLFRVDILEIDREWFFGSIFEAAPNSHEYLVKIGRKR